MKPTDKITVEITLAELAKIYLLEGRCNGSLPSSLYDKAGDIFGISWLDGGFDTFSKKLNLPEPVAFWGREDEFLNMFFKETGQQKRIRELKETITKAQQQIEELEEQVE